MSGSNPGWTFGYVPSPTEWNNQWSGKADYANAAQWDVISGLPAPGILRGCLNIVDYLPRHGAVFGSGQTLSQRQTNATQLQAALLLAANNNKFVEWPPSITEIDNTAGITMSTNAYQGISVVGTGTSQLVQFHSGAPILTIGDNSASPFGGLGNIKVDGLRLSYGSAQPANASATALVFGDLVYSDIRNITVAPGNAPYIALQIGNNSGAAAFFSNNVTNLSLFGAQQTLFLMYGFDTGSVFSNLYMNNATASGAGAGGTQCGQLTGSAFVFGNAFNISECTFDQLNIEWVAASTIMAINQANASFLGCHWEQIVMTGASPSFWNLAGQDNCNVQLIGGETIDVQWNTGQLSGSPTWIIDYDGVNFTSIGHHFLKDSQSQLATNAAFTLYGGSGGGTTPAVPYGSVSLDAFKTSTYEGFLSIDGNLPRATYGDVDLIDGWRNVTAWPRLRGSLIVNPPNNAVIYGAMGSETKVLYKSALTGNLTLVLGTNMMASGATGQNTLRPVGDQVQVIRDSAATGSFTITIKNATTGGTTLGTFSTSSAGTAQTFGFGGSSWSSSP